MPGAFRPDLVAGAMIDGQIHVDRWNLDASHHTGRGDQKRVVVGNLPADGSLPGGDSGVGREETTEA